MPKLHPDIRKYYIFRALLKRFVIPVLVLYAIDRGLTLGQMSLIAGIGATISLFFEVPSGALADSIGHRKALILSMFGQAASMACYLGGNFWWILAGTALYFWSGSLMSGTSEALFYERLQQLGLEKQHAKLYGQGKGFATAVSVISMVSAGYLYTVHWSLPFLIGTAQFLIAAAVIATFPEPPQRVKVAKSEGFLELFLHFGRSIRTIISVPGLFWLMLASAMVIGPLFGLGDFQQALMGDIGMTAAAIGVVYALKRIFSIFIQAYVYQMTARIGAPVFATICCLLMTTHLVTASMAHYALPMLGSLIIGSIAWVGLEVATNDYINRSIPTGSRATTLSMSNMLRSLVTLGSIATFGALTTHMGAAAAYGRIGIGLALVAIIPFVMLFRTYPSMKTGK